MKVVFILLTVACFCHVITTQRHGANERTTEALRCQHFRYSSNNKSYPCGCHPGYNLAADRLSCSDVDECATGTSGCAQRCINNNGSYRCSCNPGYSWAYDGKSCTDFDECAGRRHGCKHHCNNSIGSYTCGCRPGYSLAQDGKSCVDINECTTGTHGCSQLCINTNGSYTCDCRSGYRVVQYDSKSCTDVNECATYHTHGCHQLCTNNYGSYICDCRPGYSLAPNGKSCSDINECTTRPSVCAHGCQNNYGSYTCGCRPGYRLAQDKKSCDDIDECAEAGHGCAQLCNNSIGSYRCGCRPGFSLAYNTKSCIDINECERNTSGCDHLCTNRIGSFTCGCNSGYNLAQNGRSCNAKPVFNNTKDGPYDINVTEGESVTFNCNPFDINEVKISWLLNAQPISAENPPARYAFSSDKKSLTIRDVCRDCVDRDSRTDETVIQCNASNVHGYTIATGYINVLMKTKVKIRGSKEVSVDFREEKEFIFQCVATSDPRTPPTVRWYKTEPYDALVQSEPPYVNVANGFLIITVVPSCSDECAKYLGKYKCLGDNGFSQDNQTITLSRVSRLSPEMLIAIGGTSTLLLILIIVIAVVAFISFRRSRSGEDGRSHKDNTPPTMQRDDAVTGVYGVVIPNPNDPVRYTLEKTPNPTIYAELDLAPSTVYGVVVPNASDRCRSASEMAPNPTIYAELDLVPTRDTHGKAGMESEYDNVQNLGSVRANKAQSKV